MSMRLTRTIVSCSVILGIVASCSRGQTESETPPLPSLTSPLHLQIIYTPPSAAPAESYSISRDGAPTNWLNDVATLLQADGFWVERFDPDRGYVAATRTLFASEAIDCGWFVVLRAPGLYTRHNAATPVLTVGSASDDGGPMQRQMELEARVVITAEPMGEASSRLGSEVQYVVIRTTSNQTVSREAIHFRSGAQGQFADGMVCQPTGALERRTLENL